MDVPGTGSKCSPPAAVMVVVAVGSPGIVVGTAKDVVAVEAEAVPISPPLISALKL